MSSPVDEVDPRRDLLLERFVPVSHETVWAAWTRPEHVKQWFAPRPYETAECDIDLRPGGLFRTVMRSPRGDESTNVGCYLEIVERERLIWTTALDPGYRPKADSAGLTFTAVITIEPAETGTRYRAIARHGKPDSRDKHEKIGFHDGWSTALDQLVELFG